MKTEKQAFWAALILHLAILFGLFFSVLVEALRPKERPHVFEMVEPPSSATEARPAAPAEPLPAPDIPEVRPMEAIPAPVIPPPPKPAPAPTPKPPPPKRVSYEEFIKDNPIRETPARRPPAPSKPIEVPRIDTAKVQAGLQGLLARSDLEQVSRMSAQEQSELQRYGARLKARLDAAWNKPPSLAGIQLSAAVSFDVSASGTIGNVRLDPPSGNREFDASVLAAFRQVVSAGPTPTGQSHSFTLRFLMGGP